ncbi:hypothetical protein D3C75_1114970 [compost metagenome]
MQPGSQITSGNKRQEGEQQERKPSQAHSHAPGNQVGQTGDTKLRMHQIGVHDNFGCINQIQTIQPIFEERYFLQLGQKGELIINMP